MELLEVRNLKKYFATPSGPLHAVDNVSFVIPQGKTLGVVGESGRGKSTLGRTVIHLLEPTSGSILFEGRDVTNVSKAQLKKLREDMQIIFQDPFSSLNPRMMVSETVAEPLKIAGGMSREEVEKKTKQMLEMVGLASRFANSYPHELDGGRRQRVGIARALALNPKFIVCDEPVSALDVSIQAQVLNLLMDLQRDLNLTYMFITHDLAVVRYISHDIMVMYLGETVETCGADELFEHPLHPYTKALLSAVPVADIHHKEQRIALEGELRSPINPKPGCRFAARCPYAKEICHRDSPEAEEIFPGHMTRCHFVREINGL